jgi:NAD-dependent dihydropyrimidine dehydrogenase PreA subunit
LNVLSNRHTASSEAYVIVEPCIGTKDTACVDACPVDCIASGRVLGLSDLNNANDPEVSAIAAGYWAYLKALAELKHVRDSSKLNKTTPIISAGLADGGAPGKRPGAQTDCASLPDTLEFLRQHGLDELVDGYGVHFYPSNPDPNTPLAQRINGLKERAFALCLMPLILRFLTSAVPMAVSRSTQASL